MKSCALTQSRPSSSNMVNRRLRTLPSAFCRIPERLSAIWNKCRPMCMLLGLDSSTIEVRRLQTLSLVILRYLATAAVANPSPEIVTRAFPMMVSLLRVVLDESELRYKLMIEQTGDDLPW